MKQGRRTLGLVAVVAIAVVAVVLMLDTDRHDVVPGSPPDAHHLDGAEPSALHAQARSTDAGGVPEATSRVTPAVEPSERTALATIAPAILTGRCVDATMGTPLADCRVTLGKLSVVTGSDGRFRLEHVPGPLQLAIEHDGHAPLWGGFDDLKSGATRDLEDIEVPRGVTISGRVIDTAGVPVAGATLELGREYEPRPGRMHPARGAKTQCATDGSFRFASLFVAGRYRPSLGLDHVVHAPEEFMVPPSAAVVIQIVALRDDQVDSIEGVVVDDRGEPASEVRLHRQGSSGHGSTTTDRSGRFRFVRQKSEAPSPQSLHLDAAGFETDVLPRQGEWGNKTLRLVAKRTLAVELLVTDAVSGSPIDGFEVLCRVEPRQGSWSRDHDYRPRQLAPPRAGMTLLEDVRRGTNLLVVTAKRDARHPFPWIGRFRVSDAELPRQHVQLARIERQTLRLVDADRAPLAGARVCVTQQIGPQQVDEAVDLVVVGDVLGSTHWNRAILLREATTDAVGAAVLEGPAGQAVVLWIQPPGRSPTLVRDVVLQDGGPPLEIVAN